VRSQPLESFSRPQRFTTASLRRMSRRNAARERARGILRPETDTLPLGAVLAALFAIDNGRDLEALLPTIHLDSFDPPLTDDEQATLLGAIASASARCWARRWPTDCCGG
jgi:hypothetical protein